MSPASDPAVAAAAAAPAARWRKSPERTLHWRDWGGDSVVFEQYSGHTYQFAPLAAAVMACFEEDARSFEELAGVIAAALDTEPDNELRSALTAIVEQFRRLGWIEQVPHPDE